MKSKIYSQLANAAIPLDERAALIASAQELKRAALAGKTRPLLRGKNIGLLCEGRERGDAELFHLAATELGARVACIEPKLSTLPTGKDVQVTVRVLSRLYDAIECEGLSDELLQQVRAEADVPVYDGIGCANHPTAALAASLSGGVADTDNRRYVLQALLVSTIG
jgi:ornithine carbamoyltransferase